MVRDNHPNPASSPQTSKPSNVLRQGHAGPSRTNAGGASVVMGKERPVLGTVQALFLLIVCVACAAVKHAPPPREKVAQLLQLQTQSRDGVVDFDASRFREYAFAKRRPYTLMIFCSAIHLQEKANLRLTDLRAEFGHTARAFRKNHANSTHSGKLFFVDLEFKAAGEIFHRLGVQTLPYVFCLQPGLAVETDGPIKIKADDIMQPGTYDKFPWEAEHFAMFVADKAGVPVGEIDKPSFLKSPLFPLLALATLALGSYVAYHLYYAEFMKNQAIWTTGTLLVFWFAVSGGMHNIIRGVPLYFVDQGGKLQMFINQGQAQLGAEGFLMGGLCMAFALSTATLSYVAPRISNAVWQRVVCWAALLIGGFSLRQLVNAYTWKTGYRLRTWF